MFHFIGIPGHNHNESLTVIFHALEKRINGFLTKILILLGQGVGFIDEKNAIQSLSMI